MTNIRFTNQDGSNSPKLLKIVKGALTRKKPKNGRPAPHVKPHVRILNKPVHVNCGTRLTWLGHSGWLIQVANQSIMIDPAIGKHIGTVVKCQSKFLAPLKSLPAIDHVLISHDHYDHLNLHLLKKIRSRVIAGVGTGEIIDKRISIIELKWWESVNIGEVKITFVPSKHSSRRSITDQNKRLWGGFVIEAPGICIYHAGDSAYFPGFKQISEKWEIDIALLPIGAYGKNNTRSYNHITPEQAVKVFHELKAKYFFPMHWGTFQLADEPLDEPIKRIKVEWEKKNLAPHKLQIMAVGESRLAHRDHEPKSLNHPHHK